MAVSTEFSRLEICHSPPKILVDTTDSEEEEEEEESPHLDNTMEDEVGIVTDLTDDPPIETRMELKANVPYEDTYDSDGEPDLIVTGPFAEEMDAFREYRAEYLAIGGYDVTNYFRPSPSFPYMLCDLLYPVKLASGDLYYDHCILAVQRMILYLNQKRGRNLEFGELVKANREATSCFTFYATFTATEYGEKRTYQAQVHTCIKGAAVKFWEFKEAASKE
ncbi:unnamed protein product [Cuscuta campestris]|uniref:Cystatin domain-containing protein n=1 Tax=Cuscuta campestris TaxID=132261 RepID=A0A484NPJ8_9ASTE|nr:unnamed protein product [Cuscuta campestris]